MYNNICITFVILKIYYENFNITKLIPKKSSRKTISLYICPLRLELGVTKIASIICGRYIKRIMHPLRTHARTWKRKTERDRERIIHPIMDLCSKLKFVYSTSAHTKKKKKLYWPKEKWNMELKFNKLPLNVAAFLYLLKKG